MLDAVSQAHKLAEDAGRQDATVLADLKLLRHLLAPVLESDCVYE